MIGAYPNDSNLGLSATRLVIKSCRSLSRAFPPARSPAQSAILSHFPENPAKHREWLAHGRGLCRSDSSGYKVRTPPLLIPRQPVTFVMS